MKLIPFVDRRPDRWLQNLAQRTPDRVFLVFPDEDTSFTFGEAWRSGLANARFFNEQVGLQVSGHIALMLPNGSAWIGAWLGSILGGFVDVGIHHELSGAPLAHQLRCAHVRVAVCDAAMALRLAELKSAHAELLLHTLVVNGEVDAVLTAVATSAGLRVVPLADAQRCKPAAAIDLDPGDLMSIRFTSGTTGPAKAGTLSRSQVGVWSDYLVQLLDFGEEDRIYAPFPLHHHLASVMGVLGALRAGGGCIVTRQFSARRFWSTCVEQGATLGLILDPVVNILLKTPPADADQQHKVRAFYIARPNPAFEARFGSRLLTAYALTEANVLASMSADDRRSEPTCVGRVNPHYDVRVVDERDEPVAPGEPGEIVYRPLHPFTTMQSYYDNPAATVKATGNLWFHTGDRGMLDAEGFLHFYERMGDTIRRRGVNIPAFHIEEAALEYPGVAEAVAVGVPASVGEFEVKLCVMPQAGANVEPEALTRWLCKRLPREMVPRFIEMKQSFPRTITEKIIKRELKEEGVTAATVSTDVWIAGT